MKYKREYLALAAVVTNEGYKRCSRTQLIVRDTELRGMPMGTSEAGEREGR